MDRLPSIPTPPAQIWREFRIRLAPLLIFGSVVAGVVLLWRENVAAPSIMGEVEPIRSSVSSPKAGKLVELNVAHLQRVKAGDTIAQVITTDPQILQSSLAVIQAEIHLLRVNLEPVLGQQRFELSYDRLRLDWMEQRVQLVTARVRLELAEADLRRAEDLFRDKIVSQQLLDTARSAKESLKAEVEERSRLVAEQEQRLQMVGMADGAAGPPQDPRPEDVVQASIKVQEEKLRLTEAELSPIKLVVPIDGCVTAIYHRSGETVVAGEPIVTLTAINSDHILGYVREPFVFEPKVGMQVEIRPRNSARALGRGQILEVGMHMERISSTLSLTGGNQNQDVGRPVLVSLPPSQRLFPGELVHLRILPSKQAIDLPTSEISEVR